MGPGPERWLDRDAGPVVRPYTLTRGRTQPADVGLGLLDMVVAVPQRVVLPRGLGPEQRRLLELCDRPAALADLASDVDLPLGVVRVLLADLYQQGLVSVVRAARREIADASVLKKVLDGLRAL
jgi:Protein of unknown function (DUF742)